MICKKARAWLEMPAQHDHAGLHVVTYDAKKYLLATDTYRLHMVHLKDCELPDGKYDNDFERISESPADYANLIPAVSAVQLDPDMYFIDEELRGGNVVKMVKFYLPDNQYCVDFEYYRGAMSAKWKVDAMTVNDTGTLRIDFRNGSMAVVMPYITGKSGPKPKGA